MCICSICSDYKYCIYVYHYNNYVTQSLYICLGLEAAGVYTVQVANTDIIGKTLYLLRGVYVYEGYMYIIKETKCLGF